MAGAVYLVAVNPSSRRVAVEETFRSLRHVMAQLHGCVRGAFAEDGMSVGQMALLRALIHRGTATPKDLAEALSVTTGNITGLLDRLEAAGLVTRKRSAEDRRVVDVELTSKARKRFEKVRRASVDMLSEAFEGWTLPEIAQLQQLLEKLSSGQPRATPIRRPAARLRH